MPFLQCSCLGNFASLLFVYIKKSVVMIHLWQVCVMNRLLPLLTVSIWYCRLYSGLGPMSSPCKMIQECHDVTMKYHSHRNHVNFPHLLYILLLSFQNGAAAEMESVEKLLGHPLVANSAVTGAEQDSQTSAAADSTADHNSSDTGKSDSDSKKPIPRRV